MALLYFAFASSLVPALQGIRTKLASMQVGEDLQHLFERVEAQAVDLFSALSEEMKPLLLCEFQSATANSLHRDRLELRRRVLPDTTFGLAPCLKRDQFASGFDVNTSETGIAIIQDKLKDIDIVFDQVRRSCSPIPCDEPQGILTTHFASFRK